jgi:hypothetical protein
VLQGLGAAAVVAGAGITVRLATDDDQPAAEGEPEAPATLAAALVAVGRRYLDEYPGEADQGRLLDQLPALEGEVPEQPGRALSVLAPQVEADAERGEVVDLDGWVLTRTEGRAAALYAL